ncbi:MAG: hypothetical protein IIB43_07515 [Candidatus Marinimicrobia bacterium]|nr:hypothetical protein [Candidatus Neomarinimicrobiota bacterium]
MSVIALGRRYRPPQGRKCAGRSPKHNAGDAAGQLTMAPFLWGGIIGGSTDQGVMD